MRKSMLGLCGIGLMVGMCFRADADGVAVTPVPVKPAAVAASLTETVAPVQARQRYDMLMGQLDAGGDLLIVANLDGVIKEAVEGMLLPMMAMGQGLPQSQATFDCISKIPAFLDKNGFYALQGLGMSVIPRADGLNTVKCFIARDPAAADLPLWRAMVGGEPMVMKSSDYLPEDTEMVRTGTGEWRALWKLIRAGMVEMGTPQATAAFDKQLASMSTNMGVNLDKIFASMTGEGFFSVQLSKTATMSLPVGGTNAPVTMPQPSFLMGAAVSDASVVTALEAALGRIGMRAVTNGGELAEIKTLKLPIPLPFPLKPSYTIHQNMFLFGSTPDVVAAGIKAFNMKNGLTVTPDFKKAFAGLPVQNNGISYVSLRFASTFTEIQKKMMQQQQTSVAGMTDMVSKMLRNQKNMQSAMVIQNQKAGVLAIGNSSAGGKEIVTSMIVTPVAMMAAVAMPSFMKAQAQSKQNGCINNLRQMEAAKEQWALVTKKNEGDAVVESEVAHYIKGHKLPICPQGGTYTLNTIGKNCECNLPGHKLQH